MTYALVFMVALATGGVSYESHPMSSEAACKAAQRMVNLHMPEWAVACVKVAR